MKAYKTVFIGSVECVPTHVLGNILGFNVPSEKLVSLGIDPYAKTPTGIYWRVDDIGLIALAISGELVELASNQTKERIGKCQTN